MDLPSFDSGLLLDWEFLWDWRGLLWESGTWTWADGSPVKRQEWECLAGELDEVVLNPGGTKIEMPLTNR